MKIDKRNWEKVKFGDVCSLVNENTKNAKEDGLEYNIGLEHITPTDLHIRSWNTTDIDTTFTRIFRKGQVLFGRRRAYQRKVAYAEFDGICSGDIMVFQAKEDKLLPKLLPFIVQSDGFFQQAVDTSAGSLSPRTKFTDLANYEFLLPPKEEQSRLAELLWAADEVVEREEVVVEKFNAFLENSIDNHFNSNCSKLMKLGNLCLKTPDYGANLPATDYVDGDYRYIRITDIKENGNLLDEGRKTVDSNNIGKYILNEDDILIARTAVPGKSFIYKHHMGKCIFAGYLIRFQLDKKIVNPQYVYCYTQSGSFKRWIKKTIKTGTVSNINAKEYSSLNIPVPTLEVQNNIVSFFGELVDKRQRLEDRVVLSQQLKSSLINQIF
jgi:restriction endonuclease S subunit